MKDGRTISVVMCTYNGVKFVEEQIESIIGQTYPIYELIIQDDHSTDGTWEVVQPRPICRIGICCLIMRLMKIIHLALFGQWTILVSNVVMTY